MQSDLKNLPKHQLISLLEEREKTAVVPGKTAEKINDKILGYERKISDYEQQIRQMEAQIAQLKRMVFGQKRERFEGDPNQRSLPFGVDKAEEDAREAGHEKTITYVRKTQSRSRSNHKGRHRLPDHLPVEEIEIHPEGDLSGMVCIGREVTDELELEPARFYIKRYIRFKYAPKDITIGGVTIGELPERVIDKGIPGAGLLAQILVDKYLDHLPLYRQRQRFLRENIPIASSTLEGWASQGMDLLEILYTHLVTDTKNQGYVQADETPIKVLESRKKGATHKGWYWVYHNPINATTLFDYQPTRGEPGPKHILDDFNGYLQTDGYSVYKKIGKRPGVTHLACWAHARREFERALDNDPVRAKIAMSCIQGLYEVERRAREQHVSPAQRKELRLNESLPIINELGKWIPKQLNKVVPKSQMAKALNYSFTRWDALSTYLYDGSLEIDNNLVENAIRPVALGRKNYLFAGSHKAAQRAAMVYSFFAICKAHNVNPYRWLKHTLTHILSTQFNDVRKLYPQNFVDNM
jgi:transposase